MEFLNTQARSSSPRLLRLRRHGVVVRDVMANIRSYERQGLICQINERLDNFQRAVVIY